ncbi:MAG: 50S ribosomal protein L5 [Christensenellaceae bacterium]|jgi:large subunit ribosomal protein L5|nr:50S ribosomal protein L5 [Christensenellaceae bacterium]
MAKSKETTTEQKKAVVQREPKTKKKDEVIEVGASQEKLPNRLKEKYKTQVISQLVKTYKYSSVMEVPKLEKIVLNMRLGDIKDNGKSVQLAVKELELIAGQKPILTKAKHSVANFKVRQNQDIGAKVTLRASRMWDFLDKLIAIALPRVRDFRGVSPKSFDGRGNYALGIKEQLIFPEIAYDQVEKVRGFDICFVTTAKTDAEAKELLTLLGMPFAR